MVRTGGCGYMIRINVSTTVAGLLGFSTLLSGVAAAETPKDIGDRRQLLLDRKLIDHMENVRLELPRPQPAGIAIAVDRAWEGASPFSYVTVLYDDFRYRMYYRTHTKPEPGGRRVC